MTRVHPSARPHVTRTPPRIAPPTTLGAYEALQTRLRAERTTQRTTTVDHNWEAKRANFTARYAGVRRRLISKSRSSRSWSSLRWCPGDWTEPRDEGLAHAVTLSLPCHQQQRQIFRSIVLFALLLNRILFYICTIIIRNLITIRNLYSAIMPLGGYKGFYFSGFVLVRSANVGVLRYLVVKLYCKIIGLPTDMLGSVTMKTYSVVKTVQQHCFVWNSLDT